MDSEPLKNANLIQEESKGDFKDFQKKTSKKTIYYKRYYFISSNSHSCSNSSFN